MCPFKSLFLCLGSRVEENFNNRPNNDKGTFVNRCSLCRANLQLTNHMLMGVLIKSDTIILDWGKLTPCFQNMKYDLFWAKMPITFFLIPILC